MEQIDKAVLVYATFPDQESAERAGSELVDARLAACVNILPGMISIYNWEGKRERALECVLIAKTRASLADRLIDEGRSRHPYANPAFVILAIDGGSAPYLDWIRSETMAR